MVHQHPYIPEDVSLPGYQPLVIPYEKILTVFFGGSALVVLAMFYITGAEAAARQARTRSSTNTPVQALSV